MTLPTGKCSQQQVTDKLIIPLVISLTLANCLLRIDEATQGSSTGPLLNDLATKNRDAGYHFIETVCSIYFVTQGSTNC